ncbi:hypothetical protein FBU30_000292 [Linnemannia zychae]|nr:hypothetical protein FBU30_000292 [Linnemannia zychae]
MDIVTQLAFWKNLVTPNGYSYSKIPNLDGKVAIVTGANSGIGYATTVALFAHGTHPRTVEAAEEFMEKNLPLHILVNNPGIMATPFELSADGNETQFAVNHLGHFVFTMGLLNKLKESQPSRIVITSSMVHGMAPRGGILFDKINDKKALSSMSRYNQLKLANLLFGKELARRLASEKVYVNIAHPGYVQSNLINRVKEIYGSFVGKLAVAAGKIFCTKVKQGALTQLYLATSSEIEERDIRGRYFVSIAKEIRPSSYAMDEELQKLWTFSENLIEEKIGA